MKAYHVAVIGGGAAGCMAAIHAGQCGSSVAFIERNNSLCNKVIISGGGKCNFTNTASLDEFLKRIEPNGEFFRTAFSRFFNKELIGFFHDKGLTHKVEDKGRVLPVTGNARSLVSVLQEYLRENKADIFYNKRVVSVKPSDGGFVLAGQNDWRILCGKVILAAGGISYPATGSTGDGFNIAKKLGHTITALDPGLVPLKIKESFVKQLQGLSFYNVSVTVYRGSGKRVYDSGELLFTHFGLSGPLVLDMSADAAVLLKTQKEIKITIDFIPDINKESFDVILIGKMADNGKLQIHNFMQEFLPKRMSEVFLAKAGISFKKEVNKITKKERERITGLLKEFPLTIIGTLNIDEAMVTAGGVSMKEINPRTLESKIIAGLYFAGEIIQGAGISGGYNLQLAFSTGYLAAESAAGKFPE